MFLKNKKKKVQHNICQQYQQIKPAMNSFSVKS